jgi:hypothetical protein
MRVLSSTSPGERARPHGRSLLREGLLAGILGGLAVALFFGVVDARHGRPLRTPSLLGQVIFLGIPARQAQGNDPALALAYTVLHLTVFVGIGSLAAWGVAAFERRPPLALLLLLLFVIFEAGLFAAAGALAPDLLRTLGTARVAGANALAALVMTGTFWWKHVTRRRRNPPHASGAEAPASRPPRSR